MQTKLNNYFGIRGLTQHDIWLAAVVVAATNMLWPAQGKTYSVRESYATDFLLSNWLILLSVACVLYFVHISSIKNSVTNLTYAGKTDWVLFFCVCLLAVWPVRQTSTLALTFISFYLFYKLFIKDKLLNNRDYELLAAASILFAISFSRLWSPVLLKVFAVYFEIFDVFLLGKLLNLPTQGNTIPFILEPDRRALIVMGCTSFANLSAVFLLWLVVIRWLRTIPRLGIELKTVAWLLLAAICINTVRIILMITSKEMYDIWHGPLGSSITTLLLTFISVGFAVWGAKRAG